MMPIKRRFMTGIAVVAAGLVTGSAVALAAGDDPSPRPSADQVKQAMSAGPHALARARGVDVAAARTVFRLPNAVRVDLASSTTVKCLLMSTGVDSCATPADARNGWSLSVTADCETGAPKNVTVAGFAPAGATSVVLGYSDGAVEELPLNGGAFATVSKVTADSYPVSRAFRTPSGAEVASFKMPLSYAQYCPA